MEELADRAPQHRGAVRRRRQAASGSLENGPDQGAALRGRAGGGDDNLGQPCGVAPLRERSGQGRREIKRGVIARRFVFQHRDKDRCGIRRCRGDWLVYAEKRDGQRTFWPGTPAYDQVPNALYLKASVLTGMDMSTLHNHAYVARHVPRSLRNEKLAWEHHKKVAKQKVDTWPRRCRGRPSRMRGSSRLD